MRCCRGALTACFVCLAFAPVPCIGGEPARTDAAGDPLPPRAVARLSRVPRLRHGGAVRAVAFAPDGAMLASGGDDGFVRLWQVRDGKQRHGLPGHDGGVRQLAFAPDGKTLAAGDATGTVHLWDTATGHELDRLSLAPEHGKPIVALAFSPDGTRLAAGSEADLAWWEAATGRQLGELAGTTYALRALAFTPAGKSLAFFRPNLNVPETIILCEVAPGKIRGQYKNVEGNSGAFDREGKLLITGTNDGLLRLWDARTGELRRSLQEGGAKGNVLDRQCVALSADGALAANISLGPPQRLYLTRLDSEESHKLIPGEGSRINFCAAAFSPDGKWLASGDMEAHVRIWDTATLKELHPVPQAPRDIVGFRFAADGKSVLVHDNGRRLFRQRWPDGQVLYALGSDDAPILDFALSPRGDLLFTHERSAIHVRDAATGRSLRQVATKGETAHFAVLSPDGRLLAWADYGQEVHLCETETGREVRQLKSGNKGAVAAVFSPDSRTVVTAEDDKENTIRVWDAATGNERQRLNAQSTFAPKKMFFSPDGSRLVVSTSTLLALWQMKDYRRLWQHEYEEPQNLTNLGFAPDDIFVPGHKYSQLQQNLTALAFAPDGQTLVCGDEKHTAVLLNAATGERVDFLRGHEGTVRCAAFSDDGKLLYTGSADGTILVWDRPSPPPVDTKDALPPGAVLRLGAGRFWSQRLVSSLAFSPDGKTLVVAGSQDWAREGQPAMHLLELPSGKERLRLQELPGSLEGVIFSPDGKALAGINNKELYVWDLATGTRRHRFEQKKEQFFFIGGVPRVAIAYSPDGRYLADTEEKTVALRDAVTGRELRQLQGHTTHVIALAFSPDGKVLASSSIPPLEVKPKGKPQAERGSLRLWDLASGKSLREIVYGTRVNDDPFQLLHFTSDGKVLAAWRREMGVTLYDVATCREIRTIAGTFAAIAFSADRKLLATGGPTIRLWELPAGRELRSFPGAPQMHVLTFSADGKLLAAMDGERSGGVRLWDVARGQEIASSFGQRGSIQSLACSADGRTLYSAGSEGTIRVWDLTQAKERRVFEDRNADFQLVAVSGDGHTIAAMDAADAVTFWSAAGAKRGHFAGRIGANSMNHGERAKPLLTFAADGGSAFAGREEGVLRLWQAGWDKKPRTFQADRNGGIPVALSPDGTLVASISFVPEEGKIVGGTDVLRLGQLDSGQEVSRLTDEGNDSFWAAAFSPDGKILVASRSSILDFHGHRHGHRLLFWEVASGKRFLKIDLPQWAPTLAFSPDGKLLATATGPIWPKNGYTIRIWDITLGKLLEELPGHRGLIYALTFSPDGRRLFSAGAEGTILVWDTHWPHPRPRRPRADLTAEQLRRAWDDLAGGDSVQAFRSLSDMAAVPRRAVPFLRQHLVAPPPVDRQAIARLIADLDSGEFAVRDKARLALEKQGELAEEPLQKALRNRPSLEMRRQIEGLLERLRPYPLSGEPLRLSRAILALEWMEDAEARRLLETLAHGTPEARLTREAKAARKRLSRVPQN
jgi:WD40 repeat protein